MSRFSQTLSQNLTDLGQTQQQYAMLAKADQGRVSRWLNGSVVPKPEALPAIVAPFPPSGQAAILIAYLRDILPSECAEMVQIYSGEAIRIGEDPVKSPALRPPEGISDELLAVVYRVAELARDVPEIAAIFTEIDRLRARAAKAGRL